MRMRPATITRAHFDFLHTTLDPLIATAPERLRAQEAQNIAEDRLSLLYTDLIPPSMLAKPVATQSLAQRLKNMSHVNLGAATTVARQSSNDTGECLVYFFYFFGVDCCFESALSDRTT